MHGVPFLPIVCECGDENIFNVSKLGAKNIFKCSQCNVNFYLIKEIKTRRLPHRTYNGGKSIK